MIVCEDPYKPEYIADNSLTNSNIIALRKKFTVKQNLFKGWTFALKKECFSN